MPRPVKEAAMWRESISRKGMRFTEQRRHVYDALLERRDHPTAVEVFLRVKERMPGISLATVYNCLETLAACGLVRNVSHGRQSARYCPNRIEHGHFFCRACGSVTDVPFRSGSGLASACRVPQGAVVEGHDVSLHGLCPRCATAARRQTNSDIRGATRHAPAPRPSAARETAGHNPARRIRK